MADREEERRKKLEGVLKNFKRCYGHLAKVQPDEPPPRRSATEPQKLFNRQGLVDLA
jgi:hypothetical protein